MESATETEAVEANVVIQQEHTVAVVENTGEELAVEANVDKVTAEFCRNAEYHKNILSDKNLVSYRFIVKDIEH